MTYIIDVSGLTTSYLKIVPIEDVFKILRNAERCVTGRHKGFHVMNVPTALNYFVNIAMKGAPEKQKNRVKFYTSFDQLDIVDKKSLPKEYGGTIPMKEMAGKSRDSAELPQILLN